MNSYAYANQLKKQAQQTSSKGFKKSTLPQSSYINQVPLSAILERYPQFFDEIKISVVQKFINEIDKLPFRYANIEILYLSNNNLTNLQGISQFKRLKTLTLTNNDLADVAVLRQISQLKNLECLNLSGNPISKHPNYKIFLLTALPNLKNLDGKTITEENRLSCEIKAKQQTQLLALMLRNYGLIIQLNSFSQRFDIHREIAVTHVARFGRHIKSYDGEQSLVLFKRSFDYLLTLSEREKEELQDMLLKDILELFLELQEENIGKEEENYERAFQEMLKKQNGKLAELDVQITKKSQSYSQFIEEFRQKFQPQRSNQHRDQESKGQIVSQGKVKGVEILRKEDLQVSQKIPRSPETKNNKNNTSYSQLNNNKLNISNRNPQGILVSSKSASSLKSVGKKHQQFQLPEEEKDLFSKIQGNNNQNERFNPEISSSSIGNSDFMSSQTRSRLGKMQEEQDQLLFSKSQNYGGHINNSQQDFFESLSPVSQVQNRHQNGNNSVEASPNRCIPQPTQFKTTNKTKNHQDECCNKLMKNARDTSQDLREQQQSTTPYRRRNKELELILSELTKKMEQKETQIDILKFMNNSIREKLVEVKSASDQSIHRGVSQQQELLGEVDKNREKSRLLEEEVRELRNELSKMMIHNGQLSEAQKKVEEYELMNKQAEGELGKLKREKYLNEQVEIFQQKRLLRYGMSLLYIATNMECKINRFRFDKKAARNTNLLKNCFCKLRRYCILKRFSRVQGQEQVLSCLVNHFQKWKKNSKFSMKLTQFKEKQDKLKISKALTSWKEYNMIKERNNLRLNRINLYRNKLTKLKVWKSLKMNVKDYKLSGKELAVSQNRAIIFENTKRKRRFMKAWKLFIFDYARPQKQKEQAAIQLHNNNQMRVVFNSLMKNRKESVNNIIKVNKYIAHQKKKKLRAMFNYLVGPFMVAVREKVQRNDLVDLFIKKRLLVTWKKTFKLSRNLKKLDEQAKVFRDKQMVYRHFQAIKSLLEMKHKQQLLSRAVKTKKQHIVKRQVVSIWFRMYLCHQKEVLERQNQDKLMKQMFFRQWKMFSDKRIAKKNIQRQVVMMLDKKESQGIQDIFKSWKRLVQRKIRNRDVVENVILRKQMNYKRYALFQLQKELKIGLQKKINSLRNHSQLLVADCRENKEYLDNLDEERGEIAVKSREIMEQNVFMQEKVVELTGEINTLRRQITNQQKVEEEQNEIIRDLQDKLEAQNNYINDIHKDYLAIGDEEQQTQKNILENNKFLMKEISQLKQEIQEKSIEFQEYEKAVQVNTRQLVSEKLEIENKLKQSITMASEFKEKIQEQEKELSNIDSRNVRLEEDDVKQRQHIQECVQVINTLQTTYDLKIAEYEEIINQMQNIIENTQNQEQSQSAQIHQQQQELNSLRYQVSLLDEKQQTNISQFIQSLNSPGQVSLGSNGFCSKNNSTCLPINSSQIQYNNYYNYQQTRSRQQSPEDTIDHTIKKNQSYSYLNGSSGRSPKNQQEVQQNQDVLPRASSKDFKMIQQQFQKQRTQMKEKIKYLTQNIEYSLQGENNEEQEQQRQRDRQQYLRSPLASSLSVHLATQPNIKYSQNNTSTASFFTDKKHGKFGQTEKFFDGGYQQQGVSLNQANHTYQGFGKYSQPTSVIATPKGHKTTSNTPAQLEGITRNTYASYYLSPRRSGDSNQIRLSSTVNNQIYQLPTRPESSKTQKSSTSNDISLMNPTDNILNELEKSKSERKNIKIQLEQRIKNLKDNLQNGIQNYKRITDTAEEQANHD